MLAADITWLMGMLADDRSCNTGSLAPKPGGDLNTWGPASREIQAIAVRERNGNRARFGERPVGHLMLQDHAGGVRFRNIKIKEL